MIRVTEKIINGLETVNGWASNAADAIGDVYESRFAALNPFFEIFKLTT